MPTLSNKHILLGITGGIAAYKTAELTRQLKAAGADVRIVLTQAAQAFITPLTLQAVSGNPVHNHLLDADAEAAMSHIALARWADFVLIAPASAHCMAQLATGQANDLLTTLCLATDAPIAMAPAMNQAMWLNPATAANQQTLLNRGVSIWGPDEGEQACGDVGPGRMLEPESLVALVSDHFAATGALQGKHVLITAGPTHEAIDPVRYISNRSSGKMGFAMATAAVEAGASVTLISGPVALATPTGVQRIDVISAEQMQAAVMAHVDTCDMFIGCAAVADYRPERIATHKLKKSQPSMALSLVRNPDIISAVTHHKPRPFVVGFAAETKWLKEQATRKLKAKSLDMMIANDVSDSGIGFDSDQNEVMVFWQDKAGQVQEKPLSRCSKIQLAKQIVAIITQLFYNHADIRAYLDKAGELFHAKSVQPEKMKH